MKKSKLILTMIIVVLMFAGASYAETTGRGIYTSPNESVTEWLNENEDFSHTHDYVVDEPEVAKFQKGVGLDLVMYENEIVKLSSEARYNFETSVTTAMSVVELNVFKMFTKK